METVTIDPDGDVCIITKGTSAVSESGSVAEASMDTKVAFLVSSKVLGLASTVFAALLGPKFREGQFLAESRLYSSPAEIVLPDDDHIGMAVLFAVLHHKSESFDEITREQLAATARVVDKYQRQHALRHISSQWLEKHLRGIGAADTLPEYLGIALAFQQPKYEAAVVLGLAISTGSNYNASTVEERIRKSALSEVVTTEQCKNFELYRESLNTAWTAQLYQLVTPLADKPRMIDDERLINHCDNYFCNHDEAVTSTFYRIISHHFITPIPDNVWPLLHRGLQLVQLANRLVHDPVVSGFRRRVSGPECTACNFMDGLDFELLELFMSTIGSRRGKSTFDFSRESYQASDCAHEMSACKCDYSDAMRLLFGDKLGRTLWDNEDGRPSIASLWWFVQDQLGL